MKRASKKTPAQNSNCTKFEKDLNEVYFLAKEKITRKHWVGECGEFGDLAIDRYMTYIATRQIKSARPDLARLVPVQTPKDGSGAKD